MSHTPESLFLLNLSLLQSKLVKRIDYHLGTVGLSFSEYQILHSLSTAPNKTLSRIQLAESVGLSASGITRLLAPMEKIGMVEKENHPRDARMSLVKIAKGGERLYKDGTSFLAEVGATISDKLTASQFEKLQQLTGLLL